MNISLEAIGLPDTEENKLYAESAVEWLKRNTTVEVDNIDTSTSSTVKLFILKFSELMAIGTGVSSESISGLSQSYDNGQSLEAKIYALATALLGTDCLKSTVIVHSGEDGWDYEN